VEAIVNSSVEAFGNSSVEARENSISNVFSSSVVINNLHNSVVICQNCTPKITGDGAVIYKEKFKHSIDPFLECYPKNKDGENIILYKSVNPNTLCDFYTGKIKYEGIVKCPDFDSNPEIKCGKGLHLSPTPELALQYNKGKILKCQVAIKDIVVFADDITKVRCKKVKVLES
jgi:hypothetical protein